MRHNLSPSPLSKSWCTSSRPRIYAEVELPPEDFPAWLLIADLAQRSHVPPALAPDTHTGRAYTAVYQLVSTDGEMTARAALHGLRPDLLKIFLDRRRAAYDAPWALPRASAAP